MVALAMLKNAEVAAHFVLPMCQDTGTATIVAKKEYTGGSIGGPAAILAQDHIKKVEMLEYPELGMEAVYRIEVEDFPAFILVDDIGWAKPLASRQKDR